MARPGTPGALPAGAETASAEHWPLRSYLELAALPTAVPCVRLHAKNILHEWRMAHLTETVELLVSELATNAVRASAAHAHRGQAPDQAANVRTLRFWLTSDGHRVLIQVWDGDRKPPAPQARGLDAESGRGLILVEALSAQWGCFFPDDRGGKIVWAICDACAQDPR